MGRKAQGEAVVSLLGLFESRGDARFAAEGGALPNGKVQEVSRFISMERWH